MAIGLGALTIPCTSGATDLPKPHKSEKPQLQRRSRQDILQALIKSRRWDQAERVATRLTAGSPDNPQAFFLAGLVQFRQARYDRAIPLLKKAQDLQSEIPGLAKTLAICYFSSRQHPLFESQMEQAFLQTPTDPELSFFWGLHQISVKDNPPAAVKAFDNAVRLRPSYIQALYHRGRAFQKMGRKDKAREDFLGSIALIEQTFFRDYSYPYQSMARLLLEDSPKGALRFALKSVETAAKTEEHPHSGGRNPLAPGALQESHRSVRGRLLSGPGRSPASLLAASPLSTAGEKERVGNGPGGVSPLEAGWDRRLAPFHAPAHPLISPWTYTHGYLLSPPTGLPSA